MSYYIVLFPFKLRCLGISNGLLNSQQNTINLYFFYQEILEEILKDRRLEALFLDSFFSSGWSPALSEEDSRALQS